MARRLGIQSPIKGYFSVTLGGEAVNPLEMARAYATFANGGQRIDGALIGNVPRGGALDRQEARTFRCLARRYPRTRRRSSTDCFRAWSRAARASVLSSRTGGRSPARPARPRTTATRGSSATRPARGGRLGRLPGPAPADARRVPRQPGRGRHVPRADLQDVHGEGAAAARGGAGVVPVAVLSVRVSAPHRLPRRALARGQRLLPRYARGPVLLREGARDNRGLQAERGRRAARRRLNVRRGRRAPRLQPLDAKAVYKPAVPRQRVGYVLGQLPRVGARLSAYDTVTLVVAKPLHGVVPRVVGLRLADAQSALDRRKLGRSSVVRRPRALRTRASRSNRLPGVAAAPRMPVTLVVSAPAG